jgi:hypothetical protein
VWGSQNIGDERFKYNVIGSEYIMIKEEAPPNPELKSKPRKRYVCDLCFSNLHHTHTGAAPGFREGEIQINYICPINAHELLRDRAQQCECQYHGNWSGVHPSSSIGGSSDVPVRRL